MILARSQTDPAGHDMFDDLGDLFDLDIRISLPESFDDRSEGGIKFGSLCGCLTQLTICGCGTNSCHVTCNGTCDTCSC